MFSPRAKTFYYVAPAAVLGIIMIGCSLQCSHATITTSETAADCINDGLKQVQCVDCEVILEETVIPALGHDMGEYISIQLPAPDANGIEQTKCSVCDYAEEREYECTHEDSILRTILETTCGEVGINEAICPLCEEIRYLPIEKLPHAETKSFIEKEPSCFEEGVEHLICTTCEQIAEVKPIEMVEHTYGEWSNDVYATPFESGERSHVCVVCEHAESETYTVELGNNYLYIPSANILCDFAITGFTQSAVDNNDVIYTKRAYKGVDETNPFVLGHWFGSLTTMWHTPVGEYVYICIDGRIDTYKVINSEYAVEMYECYHIGQDTGVNVFDTYGSALNSQYAVYGRNHQGEDLDPENNDGRTLHMYTCHNRKDRPGWDPSHGSRGRWIILADLVHSVDVETGEVLFEKEISEIEIDAVEETIEELETETVKVESEALDAGNK